MTKAKEPINQLIKEAVERFDSLFDRMSKADISLNKPMFNNSLRAELHLIASKSAEEERKRIAGLIRSGKKEWDESGRYVNGVDMWGEEYVRHAKMDWDSRNLLLEYLAKSLETILQSEAETPQEGDSE